MKKRKPARIIAIDTRRVRTGPGDPPPPAAPMPRRHALFLLLGVAVARKPQHSKERAA